MCTVIKTLPYAKQLVFMALFDILEQENSSYKKDSEKVQR